MPAPVIPGTHPAGELRGKEGVGAPLGATATTLKKETKSYLASMRPRAEEMSYVSRAMWYVQKAWNAVYGVIAKAVSYLFCQCFCSEPKFYDEIQMFALAAKLMGNENWSEEKRAQGFEMLPKAVQTRVRDILGKELKILSISSKAIVKAFSELVDIVIEIYCIERTIEVLEEVLSRLGDEKQNKKLIEENCFLLESIKMELNSFKKSDLEKELKDVLEHKRNDWTKNKDLYDFSERYRGTSLEEQREVLALWIEKNRS